MSTPMNPGSPESATGVSHTPQQEQHVVCVDDDVDFLKSLEFFLPELVNDGSMPTFWYRFHFLDNPHDALELVRELSAQGETIAMILSDQKMPDMKGTELLAASRAVSEDAVRVLLTGYAGIESAITAINERLLDRYLTKPIENEHDFTLNVRHLLDRFAMQMRIREQNRAIAELYRFANELNALADLDSTVHYLASYASSALGCETAVVFLYEDGEFRPMACTGGAGTDSIPPITLTQAPVVRNNGGATHVADRLEDLPRVRIVEVHGERASLRPPRLFASLTSADTVIGLLIAYGPRRGAFGEIERQMLDHIATTASIAVHRQIHHARLKVALGETTAQARELEHMNRRLQVLDGLKSTFLAFISHELRTPLSGMSAILMIDVEHESEQRAKLISAAQNSYERLQGFVMRGLEYFDWLGGRAVQENVQTDVRASVLNVVRNLTRKNTRSIDVETELPETPCMAAIDPGHLESVVETLLGNAVKFAGDRAWVRVQLSIDNDVIRLVVIDRGRGFPPELALDLFQPFTIADPLHHHRGSGVSLAIARAIMESYGGMLSASSAGLNMGARFSAEWPRAFSRADAAAPIRPRSNGEAVPPRGSPPRAA